MSQVNFQNCRDIILYPEPLSITDSGNGKVGTGDKKQRERQKGGSYEVKQGKKKREE